MTFRKVFAVPLVAFCFTGPSHAPALAGDAKATILIQQTASNGLLVQAMTIDGKVKGTLFGRPVKAPAGLHIVGLRVEFRVEPKNWLIEQTKKYADVFEFPVKLEAGRSYTASGRQSGPHAEIWIVETESQKLISKVIDIVVPKCKPFKSCPDATITTRSVL
jgi:hypothetical protein